MAGCVNRPASNSTSGYSGPVDFPSTPFPSAGRDAKLDAVIDISHWTNVRDFNEARARSNILGVLHKATEGGDWCDPVYADRRPQAQAAGMLWGAYHFGTRQYPGSVQAAHFLRIAKPGPHTLLALDLEYNADNPSNTMRLDQAEDFVKTLFDATGRLPLVYTSAAWADGKPMGRSRRTLGAAISSGSILAQCQLWLADYRSRPHIPSAWNDRGWHFWQYAGDGARGGPYSSEAFSVSGVDHCDRNLFQGDASTLQRFWTEEAGRQTGA
jgi:lysozyme